MKHTVKGFITYEKSPWDESPKIGFQEWKPSAELFPHMVIVRAHSIEVEVPDNFDPRADMIANLRQQEQRAMADFELSVNQIRKRISELEAIEYTAEVAA
jgi:hypothetical protein